MQQPQDKLLFTNNLKVRIDDINYGNHLDHAKLICMIHDTWASFLNKHGLSALDCFGSALILLNVNVDYLAECFFDDQLEISMYLKNLDGVRIEFSYLVMNRTSNKSAARATTLLSFFDKEKSKITRVAKEFIELMQDPVKKAEFVKS